MEKSRNFQNDYNVQIIRNISDCQIKLLSHFPALDTDQFKWHLNLYYSTIVNSKIHPCTLQFQEMVVAIQSFAVGSLRDRRLMELGHPYPYFR